MLFGPAAGQVRLVSPRLELWSAAFTAWLDSIEQAKGRRARLQALKAWELLFKFHRCPPWDIDRRKIEEWIAHLVESDLTPNTVRCYRGRISSFYRYCSQHPALLSSDPLFAAARRPFNPVRGLLKPKESNYSSAYVLRPAEARLLLRAVDRHASLVGARDYAVLLTLLLTGLPEGDLRRLRWKDLIVDPAGARLAAGADLPSAAWEAILAYLKASGRYDSIRPDDYIFVPLADPLLRSPSGLPSDWLASRPLSTEQMLIFLKSYAAWAGLDASRVTYLSLRHTAALLQLETGLDAAGFQRLLGRSTLKDTRQYILHLSRMLARRRPRRPWVPRFVGAPVPVPFLRKQPYGQPANQNALKHGFYSKVLPDVAPADLPSLLTASLEGEILALRLLLRRANRLAGKPKNLPDALRLLQIIGLTSMRISGLLKTRQELQAASQETALGQALREALDEMQQEQTRDS